MNKFIEQYVEVEPGIHLFVRYRKPQNDRVIFFSNSLAADNSMWNSVIDELPESLGIVTYDTRGHGKSSISKVDFGIDRLGLDCVQILDFLDIP